MRSTGEPAGTIEYWGVSRPCGGGANMPLSLTQRDPLGGGKDLGEMPRAQEI